MAKSRPRRARVTAASPASSASPSPEFAAFLIAKPEDRKKVLARQHPLYQAHKDAWQVLQDAYEGEGGFLNGEYLWRFAREEEAEFVQRREQARYHNYAKSLINLYVRHVWHAGVERTATDDRLKTWWTDVDGAGTTIDDLLKRAAHLALALGHDGILMDKTPDPPTGPARADEKARVVASLYTPQTVRDWRLERNELVGIKLAEGGEEPGLLELEEHNAPKPSANYCRYLVWSKTDGWVRADSDGELVPDGAGRSNDNPGLNLVPFAILRPEASAANPFLGQPLLGNANVFRALYNRCSEEDVVLRDSSFSMLTVSVDKDGDVNEVRQQIGTEVGSTRALIAKGSISYATPDQNVPGSLRDGIQYLVQEIYRMAHVVFHRNSRDAESAEALKIKHSELNEMLTGLAAALTRLEEQLARYFFAWMEPTPVAAEAAFKNAQVTVRYSRDFFVKDLLEELQTWAEAIALDLGMTFTQRIKLRAAHTLDPDMDEKTRDKVKQEIEAQKTVTPPTGAPGQDAAALRDRAAQRLQQFTNQNGANGPIVPPAAGQAA